MESKHKELLSLHRAKFLSAIEVEKLLPILQSKNVVYADDISEINKQPSRAGRAERLLDILPDKPNSAFHGLCLALETTYPHLLTAMFLGCNQRAVTPDSRSLSLASDSEDDPLNQSCRSETQSQDLDGAKTYTRIIPSHEYDLHENAYPALAGQDKHTQLDRHHPSMNSQPSDHHRDYDRLKSQCEHAMNELQSLKRTQTDMEKRYDQTRKELENYSQKYRSVLSQLQHSKDENSHIKSQFLKFEQEKQQLDQEIIRFQSLHEEDKQEMSDLRKQLREVINESGSSEVLNKMYDCAQDKYEGIREDYEALRERYTELMSLNSDMTSKLEHLRDENMKLHKKVENMRMDQESVIMERNALKKQCTGAIHNWDQVIHERDQLKEEMSKVTAQRDELMKGSNQILFKLESACKERDAAKSEHNLVMAERASVLNDYDRLQERVSEYSRKNEALEKEKKCALTELENLKRELMTSIQERDKAIKERKELLNKYSDIRSKNDQLEGQREDFRKDWQMVTQERDVARKERHEAIQDRDRILRETYERERCQKEKAEEMDQVSKETEILKRTIDKLQRELRDLNHEVESSNMSRDWALRERDKIVQERDSIRTLCDSLRHERDRAVSDKAKTLRDFDDLKKQKSETYKELKETREKYESVMEKEARKNQLNGIGHNHSRDSAIDADLQEWETEEVIVDIGRFNPDNLGFDIVGGKDDPQLTNDNSIFISHISKGSVVDGKLRVNDILMKVNNQDTTNMTKRTMIQTLRDASDNVSLMVRRRRCITPRVWQPLQLNISLGKETGIYIEQGLYVGRITPGSLVAKEGLLVTGDRIVGVNGKSVESLSAKELMRLLDDCRDPVVMEIWRQTSPLGINSAGSSPVPVPLTTLSHLSEQMPHRVTKPESPTLKPQSMWDGNTTSDSGKSSTKMRSSGSQTDSLDSPGPPSRHKDKRYQERDPDKPNRHSVLEKIKMFKQRHKSQERSEVDDGTLKQQDLMSQSAHVNSSNCPEDVIGEFAMPLSGTSVHEKVHTNKPVNKTTRKRELESENSGTWPKCCRVYPNATNGTVMFPSPQRRHERPTLDVLINPPPEKRLVPKTPPTPPERTGASFVAVRHSPQSSDSTLTGKYRHSPQSSDSTLQLGSPSPISSPKSSSKSNQYLHNTVSVPPFQQQDPHILPDYSHRNMSSARSSRQAHKRYTVGSFGPDFPPKEGFEQHPPPRVGNKPARHLDRDIRGSQKYANKYKSSHTHQSHSSVNYSKSPQGHTAFDFPQNTSSLGGSTGSARWSSNMSSPNDGVHSPPYTPSSGLSSPLYNPSAGVTSPPYQPPHRGQSSSNSSTLSSISRPYLPYSPGNYSQYPLSPSFSSPTDSCTDCDSEPPRYSPSIDWCSSPSSSQRSSSTPSDQLSYPLVVPPRISPSEANTFPRKPPRVWYPPTVSTTSSTKSGSVEVVSERSSPGSPFLDSRMDLPRRRKPYPGETRTIHVERNLQPVGFNIEKRSTGGIFVSMVNENSLAADAGLVIGDQLLEICGINMRTATHEIAARFLHQCGKDLTLLVQYNIDEYNNGDSSGDSTNTSPNNSPDSSTFKKKTSLSRPTMSCESSRFVSLKKSSPNASLGITIAGGNAVGIFVHEVQSNSVAFGHDGLHCGDQILQYNGVDFTSVTAEFASSEIAKSCPVVGMKVQYNPEKYYLIREQPGDLFYMRAHFDRPAENEGELSFYKDNVLMVENTMHGGVAGSWFGWLVDDDCNKIKSGTIPSKERLEDDFMLRRSHSGSLSLQDLEELKGTTRRGSGTARRSFFRRRHKRNNSKDSREFSASDAPLTSESVPMLDDVSLYAYTKVDRIEYKMTRPVILLAPLAEPLINKIASASSDKYKACQPIIMQTSAKAMEQGLADSSYIDYWQQDDHYMCIRVSSIRELCDQGIHCLLNTSPAAIERLHRLQIYPIVIFARHKSFKQIREIRDPQFHPKNLSNKAAKDLFERFQKIEQDYRHQFSAMIQGGILAEMYQQVKTVIDSEQKKAIWVPVSPTR
ncbi:disks large homolog 5-like [Ylistrum balloti]|uniref:disks large homolog 5-like n=1 Tax=Ylistrum balloti TaxID=509963 RepID=UPI002905E6C9|nr:disks large homolog 5-like [Ylistrum balloti]